jgi:hypothetical protein
MALISACIFRDLSWNQLKGSIPTNRLASTITTMYVAFDNLSCFLLGRTKLISNFDSDLSHNFLDGTIPPNFSGLPDLQLL